MMNNQTIYMLFEQINADCLVDEPEAFRPLTAEYADYYAEQMENLEFSQQEIDSFTTYLANIA